MAQKIEDEISILFNRELTDQEEFTLWHQRLCVKLTLLDHDSYKLHIGQAQKWINMTLKYLSVLGEERVKGATLNY